MQRKLTPMRTRFKEYEDKRVEEAQRQKDSKGGSSNKTKMIREPFSFEDGIVCN
ncbi:hypothetical protein L798_00026 [Zootermopsis nevadensis]|uniref:Uncharacterized protein n=1 Tax=Zootermopsis nevadensis TaxID=136037 RepID=A0A067QGJ2_ZOONE|nr:hypothetical protein L798_00026 [Zootermopsis nevadensis]